MYIDVNNFNDFSYEEHIENLQRLNITKYSDLIGEEVYVVKKTYGLHKILKWDADKVEFLLEEIEDKFKVKYNPFNIIRK